MIVEPASFYSDGLKLDGSFYFPEPDVRDDLRPVIVACSGFMGLNSIHPIRFARALTPAGFTLFGFDYRGFARSEGTKGRVLLEEQISDIANASTYASLRLPGRRIILLGWGMGGGLILEAARLVPNVVGLICINGFYYGKRVQKMVRGWAGYVEMLERLDKLRAAAVVSGTPEPVDPFSIYPLDPKSDDYVNNILRLNPDFGGLFDPVLADSLLRFVPEQNLEDLSRVPILIAHGDKNRMHPPTEAESLYQKYPGPKDLVWLWGAGHTEWMADDNPTFKKLMQAVIDWYNTEVSRMAV